MSTSVRLRLAIAAGSAGVALLVVWPFVGEGSPPPVVSVTNTSGTFLDVLRERAAAGPPDRSGDGGRLHREPITAEMAGLFGRQVHDPNNVFDPLLLYRWRSNLERTFPHPAFPGGTWTVRTNSLGMREDEEVSREQPDFRVLVAGDSQTEGVCANALSFPNRIESTLRELHPKRTIEVLNAARGGYSFYHYLGVLERYRDLDPDVLLLSVYGGNDFSESLVLRHFHERTPPPENLTLDRALPEGIRDLAGNCLPQGLLQADFLRRHPDEARTALETVLEVGTEIDLVCREGGIELVLLYIPPLGDVQRRLFQPAFDEIASALGLDEEALGVSNRMADRFLAHMRGRGVRVIDGRDVFRDAEVRLYLIHDHHLNAAGNAALAGALTPVLEGLLEALE